MPKGDTLQEKQRLFCVEYLTDFNATQAAIRAGYSKQTARQQGDRLLSNVDIQKEISEQVEDLLTKAKIPLKRQIYNYWITRAFYDITEILDINGELKMTTEQLREKGLHVVIDSINTKINAQGEKTIVYKFADKDKAVEMLQKYIQMIKDQPLEIKDTSEKVDLKNLLISQIKDKPEKREKAIAELEKLTGYKE